MYTISQWLEQLGLPQYAEVFAENDVDLETLRLLAESDLEKLGVSLGHRKKLFKALSELDGGLALVRESVGAESERRQLTIMFCDLVGSTELSRKLDPEQLREVMRAYQQVCRHVIERYAGHVAQYLGDGLMVYFGWPEAHEDDAERAVRASLEIVQELKKSSPTEPLAVRIGIATGAVVVGETGAGDASVPKFAVGETPNIAARLQGSAGVDQIIISPSTHRLLASAFEYEDLGELTLKGILEPMRSWRVLGASGAEGRFAAAHGQAGLTPFVGRDEEVHLLLRRWDLVKAGEGQVVLLSGEPGIGKSRIIQALRERITEEPHTQLRFQCSPFHMNSALHPVIEHLEHAANFGREDSAEQALDKLEQLLRKGGAHIPTIAPLIASLLSLPLQRYPALNYSPSKQKEKTLEALTEQIIRLARDQPALMVFEDAHWIDPTTQEFLDLTVSRIANSRVLMVLTYRPEYTSRWSGQAHVTTLTLNRLGKRLGAELVERVTGGKTLPVEVLEQILAKTDGVPLFMEEITKAVLELGLLDDKGDRYELIGPLSALAIPATLRDSLMARLDRLAPVKEIAQIGACIGREFSYELLAVVSPLEDAQLNHALERLVESELMYRRGSGTEAIFTFKHALVQDAAYDSLLKSKRQTLHTQIAEAIRDHFPSKAETAPELLAHHYTEAGMFAAAIPCWQRAGELAQQRVALQEAIGHYERGLDLVSKITPSVERDTWELQLRALLGMAGVALHGYTHPQAAATLELAWRLDQSLDRGDYTVRILWGLWVFRLCTGQIKESLLWAERLLTRAEEVDSETMRIVGHWAVCNSYFLLGEPVLCVRHANALLDHYDQVRDAHIANLVNHDPKTVALIYRASAEWMLGFPEKAVTTAEQAISNAGERNHPFDRCFVRHFATLFVYGPRGDLDRGGTLTAEIESYATEQGLLFCKEVHVPMNRALLLAWADQYAEARVACKSAIQRWLGAGQKVAVPHFKAVEAECALQCDRLEEAILLLDEAMAQVEWPDGRERYALAEVFRVKALTLQVRGEAGAAEALFEKALDTARHQRAKSWELRTSTSLARLWQSQGKRNEAHELLAPVYEWFTEGFDTKDLKEAKALLDELHP